MHLIAEVCGNIFECLSKLERYEEADLYMTLMFQIHEGANSVTDTL